MRKAFLLCFFSCIALSVFSQAVAIRVCVMEHGTLKEVYAEYDPATGNRTIVVNGVKKDFNTVYPATDRQYAAVTTWYINNEPITVSNKKYVKYGLPRILGVNEISKYTAYQGVSVFAEAGFSGVPEVLYVPVRSGCEFQPYQMEVPVAKKETTPCATVTVKPAFKEINKGGNITFNANLSEQMKGDVKYLWTVSEGSIVGSSSGKSVTVSTKNTTMEDLWAYVTVSSRDCNSKGSASVYVKTP